MTEQEYQQIKASVKALIETQTEYTKALIVATQAQNRLNRAALRNVKPSSGEAQS